ncbi:helix-turn-helix domain-containing protein [Streptomyces globisporus]|nr:helix-turn-helix domain-containing protein [Streptomyces globisporus]
MAEEIDVRKRFASELRSHRELHGERGLTQTELAKMVRTSRSTVSRLEASSGHIPPDIPRRLDEVFETDGLFNRLYEEIESQGFPAHSR